MNKLILRQEILSARSGRAYRDLCSNLVLCGAGLQTVAVAGLADGVVKTGTALGLAGTLAGEGGMTLLVDADLAAFEMQEHLQSGRIPYGLTDYLNGRCSAEDGICETDRKGLHMMLNGPAVPNPVRLLESKRFEQLLRKMKTRYDWIIVNAPLLRKDLEAASVGGRCDGVILTIPSGAVEIRKAQDLVDDLSETGCDILGCVMCL